MEEANAEAEGEGLLLPVSPLLFRAVRAFPLWLDLSHVDMWLHESLRRRVSFPLLVSNLNKIGTHRDFAKEEQGGRILSKQPPPFRAVLIVIA